jgi:hypothetical protein
MIHGVEKNTGWMALLPSESERKSLVSELQKLPVPPDQKSSLDVLTKAKGLAVFGHLDTQANQVKLGYGLLFGDNTTASTTTKTVSDQWDKQKGQLTLFMVFLPPSVKKLAEEVINTLQFSTEGSLSMVSAKVNRATATDFFNEMQKGGPGLAGGAAPGGGRGIQPPVRGPGLPPMGGPGGRGGRGKGK